MIMHHAVGVCTEGMTALRHRYRNSVDQYQFGVCDISNDQAAQGLP
jgi:hypothetical protein